jgi:hypothetical protein
MTRLLAAAAIVVLSGFTVSGAALALPAVQRSAVTHHVGATHGNRRRSWRRDSEVHAFAFPVSSPRDAASGLTSGKRTHKPYSVTAHAGRRH